MRDDMYSKKVTQALQAGRAYRFTNDSGVSGWAVEIELPSALTPGTTFVVSVAVSEREVFAKKVL